MKSESATGWRGVPLGARREDAESHGGLQSLEQAILEGARNDAQQLLAEARARAESILAQAEKEVSAESDVIVQRTQKSTEVERGQAVALAQIEAQKLDLQHREQLLERVFDEALRRLASAPEWPNYAEIALHLVRDAMDHMDTDYALVRADAATRQVLDDEALADLSGDLGIYLRAGEPLERGTGVVVHTPDGHRRYDNTMETRLARLHNALRAPVYRILTGEDV